MKLTTIKPRLKAASLNRIQTAPAATVERKRGSAGVKDRAAIKARDNGLCLLCKAQGRVSIGVVVDHITPLWAGGSDADSNKQTLCHPCHDAKTRREAGQRSAGAATY